MPVFLIERTVPGAANLTQEQLGDIAAKSLCAMEHMPNFRWLNSFITGNTIYCLQEAADEQAIREHSRRGGFPINRITPVASTFGPETARFASPPLRKQNSASKELVASA